MVKRIWRAILKFFGWYKEKRTYLPFVPHIGYDGWSNMELDLLALINIYRLENGLYELIAEDMHHYVAVTRTETISEYIVLHNLPSHSGLFADAEPLRSRGRAIGEALAYAYSSVVSTFNALKNSPGHNAIMLNDKWDYIGIGIRENDEGHKIYSIIFS